jgi:oligopeptide/dipeptide ABC transporter ATP-binding protein
MSTMTDQDQPAGHALDSAPILEVRDLNVSVAIPGGRRALVVDNASFSIQAGGSLGLVGESGSGKTMTSLAIMGLLPPGVRVDSGEILLDGQDLLKKSQRELRRIRGRGMSMVLQDPLTALDPSFTIGSQLAEPLRRHRRLKGQELEDAIVEALEQVHLPADKDRLGQYPHQLSGGMRQRVTSAIALAGRPRLLIADEPTTALDVTTQARYLELLRELQQATGFALLLVAHDLMVVRHVCERVAVMYSSQIVEQGTAEQCFESPQHPYTRALLAAIPELGDTMQLEAIEGQAPEVSEDISGCRFAGRCRFARQICAEQRPALSSRGRGQQARCWGTEDDGWIAR